MSIEQLEARHLLVAGTLPISAAFDPSQAFNLNSLPGATKTIYLDFTGHITQDSEWNTEYELPTIQTPAYDLDGNINSFSPSERSAIHDIWRRVAEDFLPFEVNVTTQEPTIDALLKTGEGDEEYGQRIVIGSDTNDAWYDGATGEDTSVGAVSRNSFGTASDTPAFVFGGMLGPGAQMAISISASAGTSLGLGQSFGQIRFYDDIGEDPDNPPPGREYVDFYGGHGSGATSWSPIKGLLVSRPLTQWTRGEYFNATNDEDGTTPLQDDLAIITEPDDPNTPEVEGNGFGYRADDHSSTTAGASAINPVSTSTPTLLAEGIIERNTDVDYFSFEVFELGEILELNINPLEAGANLDVLAKIYDASGRELYRSNPIDQLIAGTQTIGGSDGGWAQIDSAGNILGYVSQLTLPAGTYYLSVDGTGRPITFIDPSAHPDNPDWDPDGEDPLPPDGSDWGYTDYGSLGYYQITGKRTANLVAGVDFDVAAGASPSGWTRVSGGSAQAVVNNLIVETTASPYTKGTIEVVDGVVTLSGGAWPVTAGESTSLVVDGTSYFVASRLSDTQLLLDSSALDLPAGTSYELRFGTPIDLTVSTTGTALTTVATTTPIAPTALPTHSLPLNEIAGYLTAADGEILSFVYSDLTPGDVYKIFVYGHANTDAANVVTVFNVADGDPSQDTESFTFTQTIVAGGLAVNGDDAPGGRDMETMALYVVADEDGEIRIEVTNAPGTVAGIAGVAIASTELGTISGRKWNDNGGGNPNNAGNGGQADPGEAGLGGWIVYLDLNNDGVLNQTEAVEDTKKVDAPTVPQALADYSTVKNDLIFPHQGTILDVNVTLDIDHTYVSDLNMWLVGPDGTRRLLVMDRGGNGDNFRNTTFDDGAALSITHASVTPPFTGTFRPQETLSAFNGKSAAGKWTLEIQDDGPGDTGVLKSWSIEINYVSGANQFLEPNTTTDSDGNYSFSGVLPSGYKMTPGVYFVREHFTAQQLTDGWVQSWQPPKVSLTSQGVAGGVDFGNWIPTFTTGTVSGQVWRDVDGNGVKDEGDNGLPGWIVYIDADGDGQRDVNNQPATFSATGLPKQIKDFTTITSSIQLPALGSIIDLNVTLDISHSFMADLQVFLTSPSGRTVELFTGVGGQFNDFDNITFDDDAARSIETIGQSDLPYTGTWRPQSPLNKFFADAAADDKPETSDPWILTVRDTAFADEGTLNSWSLTVTTGERFAVTDELGNYTIDELPAGPYRIREELQSGWAQTFGPTAGTTNVSASGVAEVEFGNKAVQLLGDYNGDSSVNAADYVYYRKFMPSSIPTSQGPDGNGSGTVDPGDRLVWMQHFGETSGGGGSSAPSDSLNVPESSNDEVPVAAMSFVSASSASVEDGPVAAETNSSEVVAATDSLASVVSFATSTSSAAGGSSSFAPAAAATGVTNDAAILALLDAVQSGTYDSGGADDSLANGGWEFDELADEDVDSVDALFELIGA